MYMNVGATGTLAGMSFTGYSYQNGSVLGLAMFGLSAALTVLTLLFALTAIAGLLPNPLGKS